MDERLRRLKQLATHDPTMAAQYRAELARVGLIPSDAEIATMWRGRADGGDLAIRQALRIWLHMLQTLGHNAYNLYLSWAAVEECNCEYAAHQVGCLYLATVQERNQIEHNYAAFREMAANTLEYVNTARRIYPSFSDELTGLYNYLDAFIHHYNQNPLFENQIILENMTLPKYTLFYLALMSRDQAVQSIITPLIHQGQGLVSPGPLAEFAQYTRIFRLELYFNEDREANYCVMEWDTGLRPSSKTLPIVPFLGNLSQALQDEPGVWSSWSVI